VLPLSAKIGPVAGSRCRQPYRNDIEAERVPGRDHSISKLDRAIGLREERRMSLVLKLRGLIRVSGCSPAQDPFFGPR